jgi:hypothetical protein
MYLFDDPKLSHVGIRVCAIGFSRSITKLCKHILIVSHLLPIVFPHEVSDTLGENLACTIELRRGHPIIGPLIGMVGSILVVTMDTLLLLFEEITKYNKSVVFHVWMLKDVNLPWPVGHGELLHGVNRVAKVLFHTIGLRSISTNPK